MNKAKMLNVKQNLMKIKQNLKILTRNFNIAKDPKNNAVGSIKARNDDMSKDRPLKPFKEIPGPSSLPLLGSLHHFLPGGKFYKMDRQLMCEELYRQYGPIVKLDKLLNGPDIVFLYDAESASKIYKGEEPLPQRNGVPLIAMYRQKYARKSSGIGTLVNAKGAEWKKVRTPANKVMLDPKFLSASYPEVLDNVAVDAVARFRSLRDEKNMISNITEELQLWALESSAVVAFGRRLNCLRPDLPPDSYERRLVSLVQGLFMYIEKIDFSGHKFKNFGLYKKAMATISEIENIILHFINDTIKCIESKNDTDIIPTCTVGKMINHNREAALPVAFDSLFAGVDTITQTIQFFLYCLGVNTDKQEKLREEILSGKDRKPYLRACMKESSRFMPTASAISRITTKKYQILGYEIPERTTVVMSHKIMSSMESQFPRAHEFIPERWLVEKDHPLYYGNAHPYAHGPFGFGSRSCIGQRIAQMSMEALIVNMFKEFEVKWEGPPPKLESRTANVMMPPLHFVFNNLK